MGGLKRKIPIEMIQQKDSRAVAFSKRTSGLYSKASELCLLSDAQIAIIATPVSSNSNASFYTFGHSSVDCVVAAFLANQHPREDLGFWWEDESLANSDNPEELRGAIDSMSTMLNSLKKSRFDAVQNRRDREDVKKKGVLHGTPQNQTLNLPSCSTSLCIQDDVTVNFDGFNKNTEEQTLAVSDKSNNNGSLGNLDGYKQEQELDQIFDNLTTSEALSMDDISTVMTSQNPFSVSEAVEGRELVIHKALDEDVLHLPDLDDDFLDLSDLDEDVLHLSDLEEDRILATSENKNNNALLGNVAGCNQEVDSVHTIDLHVETNSEGLLMNDVLDWDSQELDLDRIIDFETNYGSLWRSLEMDGVSMATTEQNLSSDSEAVEDGRTLIHRDLDEDNLHFSEFFQEFTSTTAI